MIAHLSHPVLLTASKSEQNFEKDTSAQNCYYILQEQILDNLKRITKKQITTLKGFQ